MVESDPQINSQSEHATGNAESNDKSGRRGKQRSTDDLQKIQKYDGQDIDEMKVANLKDDLKKLNASTIGNKTEMQTRLRYVLARERHDQRAAAPDKDVTVDDEETTDEEATSGNDASSDEDTVVEQKK